MAEISVEDWQLLSLFEVEPTLLDPGEPWYYNDAVYEVVQGDLSLSFAISPAYRDVKLMVLLNSDVLFEFTSQDVEDVCYSKADTIERLTIKVDQRTQIELVIKPRIAIRQRVQSKSDNC